MALNLRQRYRALNPTGRRMAIMLVATGVVLFLIFGFEAFRSVMIAKFMKSFANPPQTVSTAKAETSDWQPLLKAVGSLRAVNGADLSIELAGIVEKINFNSGDDVQAGQVLLQLRAEDDIARLQSLQASAQLAQINFDRDSKQLKINAVSQAVVDSDAANLKNAQAQVAQQQAVVDKKTLKAPFAGHLGIRAVDIGQYLNAGTAVVTLQALDPIYIDFFLPQQTVEQIKNGQPVTASVDTYPGMTFKGTISAINPKIEVGTRNVQVRATLANPDRKLLPGMFASISIDVGTPQKFITIPQTAVTYNPYGATVYIVDDYGPDADKHPQLFARQTFVITGSTRGDQVAVTKGVDDGQTIVTAGQIKLRNGTKLIINNDVQPSNQPNPQPQDQ